MHNHLTTQPDRDDNRRLVVILLSFAAGMAGLVGVLSRWRRNEGLVVRTDADTAPSPTLLDNEAQPAPAQLPGADTAPPLQMSADDASRAGRLPDAIPVSVVAGLLVTGVFVPFALLPPLWATPIFLGLVVVVCTGLLWLAPTPDNLPRPPEMLSGRTRRYSPARMGAFLLVMVGVVLLFVTIPPPFSTGLFAVMLVLTVFFGVNASPEARHMVTVTRAQFVGRLHWWMAQDMFVDGRVAAGMTVALFGLSAFFFRPFEDDRYLPVAILTLLPGVAAIGWLRWLKVNDDPYPTVAPSPFRADGLLFTGSLLIPATLMLWLVAEKNTLLLETTLIYRTLNTHLQIGLLFGGAALVAWALSGVTTLDPARINWREVGLALVLVALALGLRFYNIDAVRWHVHEDTFAESTNTVLDNSNIQLLPPTSYLIPLPRVYSYFQAQTTRLFGRNLAGLRGAGAIFGGLTVGAVYLLARTLFDRETALLAGLALATFPAHIHLSRIAIPGIVDPFFGVMALAFFARGVRSGRAHDYALGGVFLGFTQYFYEGGRLLYPLLFIGWVTSAAVLWRRQIHWRGVVLTGVAAALVAMPLYYTLALGGHAIFPRMGTTVLQHWSGWASVTSIGEAGGLLSENFRRSLFFLIHYPDRRDAWLYYGGEHALVMVWLVPIFLGGLAYCVTRWRTPAAILVLGWVIGGVMTLGFVRTAGVSMRYRAVFPGVALALAVGFRYMLPLVMREAYRLRETRLTRGFVVGALAVIIAVTHVTYYYTTHIDAFRSQLWREIMRCGNGLDAYLRIVDDAPPNTVVHLIGQYECNYTQEYNMLHYLRDDLRLSIASPEELDDAYFENVRRDLHNAFFVWEDDFATPTILNRTFQFVDPPAYSDHPEPYPGWNFVLYRVYPEADGPAENVLP